MYQQHLKPLSRLSLLCFRGRIKISEHGNDNSQADNQEIRLAVLEEAKERQEEFQKEQIKWQNEDRMIIGNLQTVQAVLSSNLDKMEEQRKEDIKMLASRFDKLEESDRNMEENIKRVARETGANLTPMTTAIIAVLSSLIMSLLTSIEISGTNLRVKIVYIVALSIAIGIAIAFISLWVINMITRKQK